MSPRALAVAVSLALGSIAAAAEPPAETPRPLLLLDQRYPVEVAHPFHTALLHWMDSLVGVQAPGLTAGKTVRAHRLDYARHHPETNREDLDLLRAFHEVRRAHARTLTDIFFDEPTLDAALRESREVLSAEQAASLERALRHYEPRYRPVWNDAEIPRGFVRRCARDPQRQALAGFLVDVASFYDVAPANDPPPRLVVVPVADGYGTHAQAIGRHLLIEVREWESLTDEVAPIVHENAHFLFERIPPERMEALRQAAFRAGQGNMRAWNVLREALPTAIAQGVAAETFLGDRWSRRAPWYHLDEVDAYAKKIFPLVRRALRKGGKLDEELLERMIEAYPFNRR